MLSSRELRVGKPQAVVSSNRNALEEVSTMEESGNRVLWRDAQTQLHDADPLSILRWAAEHYQRIGFTCSFSGTGIVLAHMIGTQKLPIPVYFLDTGFLFPETLATRREFAERYGLSIIDVRPDLTVEQQAERYGEALYARDPDLCCHLRKVTPMQRILEGLDAWISGLRRDQSATRGEVEVVELHTLDDGRTIAKINPLAYWTKEEAWLYIAEHKLPYNPLMDRGYKSIGCWTCTRPVAIDANERDGRWDGTKKTECGLHTFTKKLSRDAPQ